MVIVLLCSQYNVKSFSSMLSFSASKNSVLNDKGMACFVAGASVALATSLAAVFYCYKVNARSYLLKKKKEEFEKNCLLQEISLIESQEQNNNYNKSHKNTLKRETPFPDIEVICKAWENEAEHNQQMPPNVRDSVASFREEWNENSGMNVKKLCNRIRAITQSSWYQSIDAIGVKLSDEIESLEAKPKSNWSKLFRNMGLGYLASLSLMLYGLNQRKA